MSSEHDWHFYDGEWEVRRRVPSGNDEPVYDLRHFPLLRQVNNLSADQWNLIRSGEIDEKALPFTEYEQV